MDIYAEIARLRRTVDRLKAVGFAPGPDEFTMTAPLVFASTGYDPGDIPVNEWLVDGPLALWPLVADLEDISGNDHHLSVVGGSWALTGDPAGPGLVGDATFATGVGFSGSAWTIEAVHSLMSPVASALTYHAIITDGDETTGAGIFLYDLGVGDAPYVLLPPATNYADLPYTSTYERAHLAAVCDGSSTVLYVNGAPVTTSPDPAPAITPTGADLVLGGTEQARRMVVLYDYALSATRVAAHAAAAGF